MLELLNGGSAEKISKSIHNSNNSGQNVQKIISIVSTHPLFRAMH